MALTLEQEHALLALLEEPLVTLNELPKAQHIADGDLFLTRQETVEKAATGETMKRYFAAVATLEKGGTVQLTNAVDSDSEALATTAKALKQTYELASAKLTKADNLADLTDKQAAIVNLGLVEMLYPVGAPIPWPREHAPTGYLKCNGAAFDTAKYPRLAQAYPSGNLPDLRGEFIRGWDDGRGADIDRAILSQQTDTLQNIVGEAMDAFKHSGRSTQSFSGAFAELGALGGGSPDNHGMGSYGISFDASRVARTSNETRPRNIAFLYIVRAA